MFNWLRNLCSTDRKVEQIESPPLDEILKRYEVWCARRAKYVEPEQQRLDRGECNWEEFTSRLVDIETEMLSDPAFCAEIDAIVEDLCRAYLAATPSERTQIQTCIAEQRPLSAHLEYLPEKMVTKMMSPKDVTKLLCGLAALSIQGGRSDYRDTLTVLADLFVRAEEVGIAPRKYFRAVAGVSRGQAFRETDTELAEMLRDFHTYAIVDERRRGRFS